MNQSIKFAKARLDRYEAKRVDTIEAGYGRWGKRVMVTRSSVVRVGV